MTTTAYLRAQIRDAMRLYVLCWGLLALLAVGCQNNAATDTGARSLSDYQSAYKNDPSPAHAQYLFTAYEAALQQEGTAEERASYLLEMARLSRQLSAQNPVPFIQQLLRQYPTAPERQPALQLLEEIYRADQSSPRRATLVATLRDDPSAGENIVGLLDTMLMQAFGVQAIDRPLANEFIESAELLALLRPQLPASPRLLYKAAETANALRQQERALELYRWLSSTYPRYEKAGNAVFMQAFLYDENTDEPDSARWYYEQFISNYPEHELVPSAKILLENIGKSDEEMLRQLQGSEEPQ